MKKMIALHILFLLVFTGQVKPQNNKENNIPLKNENNQAGITVALGGSITYYYGPGDRNFGKFDKDRINFQGNGLLGFTLAKDKSGRKTLIAAFGNYGINNEKTISEFIKNQGYISTAASQSAANNYFQLEAGLLIADIIRISTGIGQQHFDSQILVSSPGDSTNKKLFKYNSTTVGFRINFGNASWLIECNIASGNDLNSTVLTPSTGLMFRF